MTRTGLGTGPSEKKMVSMFVCSIVQYNAAMYSAEQFIDV